MRWLVFALALVGAYCSVHMQQKSARAQAGELREKSVVQTPRAHVFGNVQNSAIGLAYYGALAAASFFLAVPIVHTLSLLAAILAAATSIYLAYSLLFVTRMECVYCWTSHVVNWSLLALFLIARM